jgi:spore coat polysaccharide biosynthesis protein SpsF (cytidylyltransferase family)
LSEKFRFGGIILARMDSSRLPGKALTDFAGQPLLQYAIDGAKRSEAIRDVTVVATTERAVDDPIAEYCRSHNVDVYRGETEDVSARALGCARSYSLDYFARLNGDSPFVDHGLLDQACEIARTTGTDFVTNVRPRSYPYGLSVEVFKTEVFARGYAQMSEPHHFEHVTLYFYEHLNDYSYRSLIHEERDLSSIRLTVDTPEDKDRFETLRAVAGDDWEHWGLSEIVNAYNEAGY